MNVLIVEDSELKIKELELFIEKNYSVNISYDIARTFKDSAVRVVRGGYDLIILDMTMPVKSGGGVKTRALAGRDILGLIKYNNIVNVKVIIFSQFGEFGGKENILTLSDIYEEFKVDFPEYILGCIQYSGTSDSWKKELKRMLKELKLK